MKLGVIGCGKMGTALAGGGIRSGAISAADLIGVDPLPEARNAFAKATGAAVFPSIHALEDCETILLCTKPHDSAGALRSISALRASQPLLVISIAAGITIASLESAAAGQARIIRAMPNTPALIGKGATGYCLGSRAKKEDAKMARQLFESVGLAIEIPERLLNAVTGLSGSGPAYGFLLIEALADGGVRAGLPRAEAIRLAAQTLLGAASMVLETGEHPAILKDMVASPGGTTIAGLAELERRGVRSAMIDAVSAATHRASELG